MIIDAVIDILAASVLTFIVVHCVEKFGNRGKAIGNSI